MNPPELAGLCTYQDAARPGFSVEESVRRLMRLHWCEKRLAGIAVARLPATPDWEVKCALALHQWQDGEHAAAMRARVSEMRSPPPPFDRAPHDALETYLDETLRAHDTVELVAGLELAHAELADVYRAHLDVSNPLVDHPTRRVLRFNLIEEEEAVDWYRRALDALTHDDEAARTRAEAWRAHLCACLAAAGGIAGRSPGSAADNAADEDAADDAGDRVPAIDFPANLRSSEPFVPDMMPQRDERFRGRYDFDFPPQTVYNAPDVPADERNLALLCRRTLEMDVPETMASFMTERRDRSWQFYRDYGRQLWDEARHAMMGTVALTSRGVDWTTLPLNIGFSLRLNCHAEPIERQILLYAIEQSLMPADTGKRSEYETAIEAGDALSAHFHDFDWADEVLHAQIGRRLLKEEGISMREAMAQADAIHAKTWAALDQYRANAELDTWQWWRAFVQDVLGHESVAVPPPEAERPTIIAQGG